MAITLKSEKYNSVTIDSNIIIGVLGEDYQYFLKSLTGNVYHINNSNTIENTSINENFKEYFNLLNIESILKKNSKDLSHSEKRILKYFMMCKSNNRLLIIDEPYLDLDYREIKIINNLLKKLVKLGKTIIIASSDINVIYSLCKKVIIIDNDNLYYSNIECLNNVKVLKKYNLDVPNIVEFIELAKKKNVKIPYSKDIRDLIKDVYRNVSKK